MKKIAIFLVLTVISFHVVADNCTVREIFYSKYQTYMEDVEFKYAEDAKTVVDNWKKEFGEKVSYDKNIEGVVIAELLQHKISSFDSENLKKLKKEEVTELRKFIILNCFNFASTNNRVFDICTKNKNADIIYNAYEYWMTVGDVIDPLIGDVYTLFTIMSENREEFEKSKNCFTPPAKITDYRKNRKIKVDSKKAPDKKTKLK